MKNYDVVLFDLDGTLTDPKVGITKSVANALLYFGIEVEDLDSLCKFIGPPLNESFMKYYGLSKEQSEIAISKYRDYFGVKGLYENYVYPGVEELLINLSKRGKSVILATSKPTIYATKILEHFNLLKYFNFVSGSELDGTRVKKAEVIRHALTENKLMDLSKIIMVGDREHDIFGAKEVGIDSIGVLYGYGDYEELLSAGAKYIVKHVIDIERIILV